MIRERERQTTSGLLMLVVFLALIVIAALGFIRAIQADDGGTAVVPRPSSWR